MRRTRAVLSAVLCLGLCSAAPAYGNPVFHPRIGSALGVMPPYTGDGTFGGQDIATGALIPVTYHAGNVMAGGVTIHTIFWAPSGFAFQGSPQTGVPGYVGMVQKFFTDVAADSGKTTNVFSVLPQFAEGTTHGHITPGAYSITYSATADSITDTDPYPAHSAQCASPQSVGTCVTDRQVQAEVDKVISSSGGSHGVHDLWYVFTPPDVDECIAPGVCESNAYGGYHSLSNLGHGLTIYAYTGDPIVETRRVNNPGDDPEGNPDAEITTDIAAHETVEAMTDPEGVGYMDPNGYEVGDKCEFGPQYGTPLGYAGPDHSPYNQTINGDPWLIQEMWANHDNNGNWSCVQQTSNTQNDLPLPQVNMFQFSSTVSGDIERPVGGVTVTVSLIRAAADGSSTTVAQASTSTAADGTWSVSLAPHAVGDDRDEIDVDYSGTNAPSPNHQVILTGNGGNALAEAGWTGWTFLDAGTALTNNPALGGPSLTMAPCFQTGVLQATVNGHPVTGDPLGTNTVTDYCNTLQVATAPLGAPVTPSDVVVDGSLDNRAFQDPNLPTANPFGGLVNLAIPVGEADSVSTFGSGLPTFSPTGFPTCSADLEAQAVSCSGLVPSESYTLANGSSDTGSATADGSGTISVSMPVTGGDQIALSNGSRTLTTLHVAHLKVNITGDGSTVSSGTCEPGDYMAPPLSSPPTNAGAGEPTALAGGAALTDAICPANGDATGFSGSPFVQTDELSGGSTATDVPGVADTSPMEGEIVYGGFLALAESDSSSAPSQIALSIAPSSGGSPVFTASNVETSSGVSVPALTPGTYTATWTVSNANGDTRTVTTRFVAQSALQGPQGPQGPSGPRGRRGKRGPKPHVHCRLVRRHHHLAVKCVVSYGKKKHHKHHKKSKHHGRIQMRVTRGGTLVGLGHASLGDGTTVVWMRALHSVTHGRWAATVVITQPKSTSTTYRV